MAIGLQSLATVKEDTEVRDRFIDDSLKSYNPDSFIVPENYSKPDRPPSVGLPPDIDPFSEDFSPFTTVNPFTDLEVDPPKMDITTAVENLNLDEGGNNAVSQYAANTLQNDNNSESEQKAAVETALLNEALGPLDLNNSNIKGWLKDNWGLDIDQHMADREARKEGGMPFINAGLALTQASRAGLNVPQAITSAIATFSATKDKLNQLDPLMLKLAIATLPKTSGVGDIEGQFDTYAGDRYLGRSHLTDAMVLGRENRGFRVVPVAEGENATSKYYVLNDDNEWDIQILDDQAYARMANDRGADKVQRVDEVMERTIVPVYDSKADTFDTMPQSEYNRLKAEEGGDKYSIEEGDYVEAEYTGTDKKYEFGETRQVNKSWLAKHNDWKRIPGPSWSVSYKNGLPVLSNVPSSIAGTLKLDAEAAKETIDETRDYLMGKSANLAQMSTTIGQVHRSLGELDGRAGALSRWLARFSDTVVGGAKEVLGGMGKDVEWADFEFVGAGKNNSYEEARENFSATFKELDEGGAFGFLDGLSERGPAAFALENALFSLALQNAMNSYDQTARSISDRDLQFFLRNIGSASGTTEALVRSLTDEIGRSTLAKFDDQLKNRLYFQPTDRSGKKPLVDAGYFTLIEGKPKNSPDNRDYELDPQSPLAQARVNLQGQLDKLITDYGTPSLGGTTTTLGGDAFMNKMSKATEPYTAVRNGMAFEYKPALLTNQVNITKTMINSSSPAAKELNSILNSLVEKKTPSMEAILGAYNTFLYPKIYELMQGTDDQKALASEMHNDFLGTFFSQVNDQILFDNLQFAITNYPVK